MSVKGCKDAKRKIFAEGKWEFKGKGEEFAVKGVGGTSTLQGQLF